MGLATPKEGNVMTHAFKWLTPVGHLKGEPTVLGSRPRQWRTVLSSKQAKVLVRKQDVRVRNVTGFPFVVRDYL